MNIQQQRNLYNTSLESMGLYLVGGLYNFVADNTDIAVLSDSRIVSDKIVYGSIFIRLAVEEIRTI